MSDKNYYEVLGVPTTASRNEIANGYQQAKMAYSPDGTAMYSLLGEDECREILTQIDEAFAILYDQKKREEYNNAHGIQNVFPHQMSVTLQNQISNNGDDDRIYIEEKPKSNEDTKINRLVAQKKFALDYNIDEEFEKEIEQTTEFTGEFLKKIREYRNVTISRLSEMTKISKTYLQCIEEEDISRLPATAYIRGFIFQYAKCLKLPPDLVATSYIYRIKQLKGDDTSDGLKY